MGKRTRKRRQNNNKTNNNKTSGPSNSNSKKDNNNNDSSSKDSSSSVLLQRIRHSDPRTRHAALAAVANTLLDPTTAKTASPSKISTSLLQAIRERVMDADLDVSQIAAGCLANYITIVSSTSTSTDTTTASSSSMTAGWTLVLVGRLKQCYEQFLLLQQQQQQQQTASTTAANNNNNNNNKPTGNKKKKGGGGGGSSTAKMQKQWLALAVQCLRGLCLLMESNPEAVGRLTTTLMSSTGMETRQNFHQTILEWIQQCQQYYSNNTRAAAAAAATASNKQLDQDDAMVENFYKQIVTLASRTLHSAWDDNPDLLLPWREESPQAFPQAIKLLETIIQMESSTTSGTTIPVVAQLHCMGAYLTARPSIGDSAADSSATTTTIQQILLPKLGCQLQGFCWSKIQSLLQTYQQASVQWQQEQADDALEKDVIRKVTERKEPARLIARRQKLQKEKAEEEAKAKQQAMEEDDDNDNNNKKVAAAAKSQEEDDNDDDDAMDAEEANDQQQQQVETQQALEQARDAWNQFLLPLQLSLELLANMTSSTSGSEEEEDEDMMMMDEDDWGPDQEAQLMMQEQQQHQQQNSNNSDENNALHKLLVESQIPQQLQQLFQQVYNNIPQDLLFPEQSLDDIEDLQSKTMACLGNCWENIPQWPGGPGGGKNTANGQEAAAAAAAAAAISWTELHQAATTTGAAATGVGKEGLVSAMVIALRTYPSVRKQWQPDHVTFWLNELTTTSNNNNKTTTTTSTSSAANIQRDIITMLGILCSQEPHPVEVNHKICSALLSVLTTTSSPTASDNESNTSTSLDSSIMIPCEVLNVLMDMYGNDDDSDGCCHVSVFDSLQVLGHFQRSIPTLKSKLKKYQQQQKNKNKNGVDSIMVDVEQWKETLLNASRFVQYKKGQL